MNVCRMVFVIALLLAALSVRVQGIPSVEGQWEPLTIMHVPPPPIAGLEGSQGSGAPPL